MRSTRKVPVQGAAFRFRSIFIFFIIFFYFFTAIPAQAEGSQTIPYDITTDQAVIDQAVLLLEQYHNLGSASLEWWNEGDILDDLKSPALDTLRNAILGYKYTKAIHEAVQCDKPGMPACNDIHERWLQIADAVGSLTVELGKEEAKIWVTKFAADKLLGAGAGTYLFAAMAPAMVYFEGIKLLIGEINEYNIRNRIAFYIAFKQKFPSQFDGVNSISDGLNEIMTKAEINPFGSDVYIAGNDGEYDRFKLSFFLGI